MIYDLLEFGQKMTELQPFEVRRVLILRKIELKFSEDSKAKLMLFFILSLLLKIRTNM